MAAKAAQQLQSMKKLVPDLAAALRDMQIEDEGIAAKNLQKRGLTPFPTDMQHAWLSSRKSKRNTRETPKDHRSSSSCEVSPSLCDCWTRPVLNCRERGPYFGKNSR